MSTEGLMGEKRPEPHVHFGSRFCGACTTVSSPSASHQGRSRFTLGARVLTEVQRTDSRGYPTPGKEDAGLLGRPAGALAGAEQGCPQARAVTAQSSSPVASGMLCTSASAHWSH